MVLQLFGKGKLQESAGANDGTRSFIIFLMAPHNGMCSEGRSKTCSQLRRPRSRSRSFRSCSLQPGAPSTDVSRVTSPEVQVEPEHRRNTQLDGDQEEEERVSSTSLRKPPVMHVHSAEKEKNYAASSDASHTRARARPPFTPHTRRRARTKKECKRKGAPSLRA